MLSFPNILVISIVNLKIKYLRIVSQYINDLKYSERDYFIAPVFHHSSSIAKSS